MAGEFEIEMVDELPTTTPGMRYRIDFDKLVEFSIIEECSEIALRAPTGCRFSCGDHDQQSRSRKPGVSS